MIHYHGTPIGGSRQDVARFLIGRHCLIPWARPDDLAVALDVCSSVIADCSEWTRFQQGGEPLDLDDYMAWVRTFHRHPAFDWCVIPDRIDGDVEQNARLVRDWVRCAPRFVGVPVWHLHEPLEYLAWLVDSFHVVAFGSSGQFKTPGTPAWWKRMAEAMGIACDKEGRPKVQIHGLRMLDPDIFTRVPFRSADSTNAAVNCGSLSRFGSYVPPTSAQRAAVIAAIIETQNSPAVWCETAREQASLL